jgi:regulator of CtrA degradation
MALVERTAQYLDGEGRAAAKKLKAPVSLTYATESMRLTTRLLELASWLLIRRSVKQGDISADEAQRKRARIRLSAPTRVTHVKNFDELPEGLRGLIAESAQLNDRIIQLDRAMSAEPQETETPATNPVANQLAMLQTAFAR